MTRRLARLNKQLQREITRIIRDQVRDPRVGSPTVTGATVITEVVDRGKDKKIIIFKYKAKTRYRRKNGHRQLYTDLKVTDIKIDRRRIRRGDSTHAPDSVLQAMGAVIVSNPVQEMIRHGRPLPASIRLTRSKPDERCRAYSVDGEFIAILAFDATAGQWRPEKVFSLSYPEDGEALSD